MGKRTIATTILVLLAIILVNVYSRYGVAGVRGWFAAKFLNRPMPAPTRARRRAPKPPIRRAPARAG